MHLGMITHAQALRTICTTLTFLAAAFAATLSGRVAAQGQPASAPLPAEHLSYYGDSKAPDLSGVWVRQDPAARPAPAAAAPASKEGWTPWPPPVRPPFLATWQARVGDAAAGKRTDDPVRACMPPGMPRFITGSTKPMIIIQTPGRATLYRDGSPVRRLWLDGRPLPGADALESFYEGTAAGRYDGSDMVVETAGLRDQPIDSTGVPHSDDLHITERYHRVDANTLSVEVTLNDPQAFTQAMTTKVTYAAFNDAAWEPREFICSPGTNYHPDFYVQ